MRLTAVLILSSLLQVSASTYAQRITIEKRNAKIETILREIRKQSGYDIFYNGKLIPQSFELSFSVSNVTVDEALNALLKDLPFEYEIDGKKVAIKKREAGTADKLAPWWQRTDVQGIVEDEKGNKIAGATVKVKGTQNVVITGADGAFVLRNVEPGATIVISFLGYATREIKAGANLGKVVLQLAASDLSEVNVVSTGYQKLLKERAPGAYDKVGQEVLSKRPVSNLSTALQGLVPGMQAKENADGSVQFLIRGSTSMYADRAPLVVVDGFPISQSNFSNINPNDVESVTVLKDATAASIWGARSANGVIVITTKKNTIGRGVKVEGNVFTRISERTDLDQNLTQATSAEQIAYERLGFANNWLFSGYAGSFADINKPLTLAQELLYANKNGKITLARMNASLDSLAGISNRDQISDLLLRRAVLSQYNVNLMAGTEKSNSYASLLFEDNKTRFQGTGYKRYNLNFNNEYRASKNLTFNFGLNLQYRKSENSGTDFGEIQQLSPYETLLNPDGSYSVNLNGKNREQLALLPLNNFPYSDWGYNLLREVRGRKYTSEDLSARIQAGVNLKIIPGLNFDSKIQYEKRKLENENFNNEDTYYVRNIANTNTEFNNTTKAVGKQFVPKGGIQSNTENTTSSYVFRNQLNFSRYFGTKHSVDAIAGMEISQYRTDSRTNPWIYGYYPEKLQSTVPIYGYGSPSDQFTNFQGTSTTLSGGTTTLGYGMERFVSYYGNVSYTYDNKYTVSGSIRSDASNFITENPDLRWAPLWSVGALWNAKAENFLKGVDFLDRLSFRLTYGRNGNVERSTSTKTLLSVSTSPSTTTGTITATISDNGNPTLRWEKTTTTNFGIDFSLLRNKLFGKIDLYNKIGTDITGLIALPAATGTTSQRFNNAGIINRGIEIELGTNIKVPTIDLAYTTSFNYAYNKNKVTSLYYPALYAFTMVDVPNAFVEGRPINPVYSYTYAGVIGGVPQVVGPGGVPNTMNSAALHNRGLGLQFLNYEGTATPPHTLGWFNNVRYRDFSLSFLVLGKLGGVYRNETFNYASATLGSSKTFVNRYISDVLSGRADVPPFPAVNETQMYLWDRYVPYLSSLVESSSYIEFKELSFDYTLPKKISAKLKSPGIRVYAQARDLGLIWAANKNGYNPDWLPGTDRPLTTYTLGINFIF